MKLTIPKGVAVVAGLTSLLLASPLARASDTQVELYNLCSKFPLNSRCEGYDVPVPLENRQGSEGECSFVFGESDRAEACKFTVDEEKITLYLEEGDPLSLLGDERATREVLIPIERILTLNYSEYNQVDNVAQFLVGALLYELSGADEEIVEVEVGFTVESDSGQTDYNFLTIVTDRESGVDLRSQLGRSADLQAGIPSDEIVAAWLAAAEGNADNAEQVRRLLQTHDCNDCDLQGANLSQSSLDRADLEGANLERANLEGVSLEEADLEGANLRGANLENATLSGANLTTERLTQTSLRYANLSNANLTGANLEGADLGRANLRGANLTNANLSRTTRSNSWGTTTRRIHTSLSGADLSNANLNQADLRYAFLGDTNLSHADLRAADLGDATLNRANLSHADLSGADLEDASLREANLLGANLDEANLEDANLCGATMPDGSISDRGCE